MMMMPSNSARMSTGPPPKGHAQIYCSCCGTLLHYRVERGDTVRCGECGAVTAESTAAPHGSGPPVRHAQVTCSGCSLLLDYVYDEGKTSCKVRCKCGASTRTKPASHGGDMQLKSYDHPPAPSQPWSTHDSVLSLGLRNERPALQVPRRCDPAAVSDAAALMTAILKELDLLSAAAAASQRERSDPSAPPYRLLPDAPTTTAASTSRSRQGSASGLLSSRASASGSASAPPSSSRASASSSQKTPSLSAWAAAASAASAASASPSSSRAPSSASALQLLSAPDFDFAPPRRVRSPSAADFDSRCSIQEERLYAAADAVRTSWGGARQREADEPRLRTSSCSDSDTLISVTIIKTRVSNRTLRRLIEE